MGSVTNTRTGGGNLYIGAEGATEPTNTGSATGFSDAINTTNWTSLGYTDEGHKFKWSLDVDPMTADEEYAAIGVIIKGIEATVEFDLEETTNTNLQYILGGTKSTSGTGATTVNTWSAMNPGAVPTRYALLWESLDKKERWIYRAGIFQDDSEIEHKKGEKVLIPATFMLLTPADSTKRIAQVWYAPGA